MKTNTSTPGPSDGERIWRTTFFLLSAAMTASALVDFDAGRYAQGMGNLGAAVLMLSVMVRFPFLRAVVKASSEQGAAPPARVAKQREELMKQAEKVRTANPWAEHAGRAGWILLAASLLLRVTGVD